LVSGVSVRSFIEVRNFSFRIKTVVIPASSELVFCHCQPEEVGAPMVGYRCYILDADDHIVQAHDLDCATDAQAALTAEHLLSRDPYHGAAEVWAATRRVLKLERDATQRLRLTPRPPFRRGEPRNVASDQR
jgi:hypothetical protein